MIGILRDLAQLLASDAVSVDVLVKRLGPVSVDHGPDAALDLQAGDARFTRIQLWRDSDTGVPSMIALDVTRAAQPTIRELATAFGGYRESLPVPDGAGPELIFQGVARGAAVTTLVAGVAQRTTPLDSASATVIRLIREPRLD